MQGSLVDPLGAFARRLADSAQARCSRGQTDDDFHPALLGIDSGLYLLTFDTAAVLPPLGGWLESRSKWTGQSFPAGNAYLIMVDSIRPTTR
jgi:hypothetical protein